MSKGLLPLLKSIQKPCSLKQFSGQTIGVDAYGWLHRGTIACAIELAQGTPTNKYESLFIDSKIVPIPNSRIDRWVNFFMTRVRMLIHFGIKPYLVFDGDYLPSKSGTEKERAARRRESKKTGLDLLRLGKTSQAQLELQKSIDVTPDMARQLIEELKKANVTYVVAPYEADVQLAFLERRGFIDAVLSEDSDLLVFGTQCLLTKLDQYGECIMIKRSDFTACREISLVGWSDADFRLMAILSGCDYLPGIEKMGLKTAYRMIRKHKSVEKIVRAVQFDGKMKVPPDYLDAFARAEATFLYQWVYCPKAKCLINYTEPAADVDLGKFPCIGKFVDPTTATGVASGHLHPHTKLPITLPGHMSRAPLRTSMSASTPDTKKHKPIESFFASSRRTPLAELSPNLFTPSPSQREVLQRSPASWSAEPVTRRPMVSLNSPLAPSSAPQRLRRAVTDMRPPRASAQSPKRIRLCSDGIYATPQATTDRVESGTSRFFETKRSSSLSCGKKGNDDATNEFNLRSDDSVELAMSQMPEKIITKRSKSKTLKIFDDNAKEDTPDDAVIPASSPPASADELTCSSDEPPSLESSATSGETLFTSGLSTSVDLLRFKYSPDETQVRVSDTPKRRHTESSLSLSGPRKPARDAKEPLKAHSPSKRPADTHFDEAEWEAAEAQGLPTLPCGNVSVSSSRVRRPGKSTLKGSEDLIIPDSEDDEEEIGVLQHTGFSFDLGKFAFSG